MGLGRLQSVVAGSLLAGWLTLSGGVALAFGSGLAPADDPIRLQGQITDKSGVLGSRTGEVQAALDRLQQQGQTQLFVAYVPDFGDRSAQQWADETALINGLGINDLLLAVATRQRNYHLSGDTEGLSQAQLNQISSVAIEPALQRNDWAGAAVGAANGTVATLTGQPVVTPTIIPGPPDIGSSATGRNGGGTGWVGPVLLLGGAGAGGYLLYRSMRRRGTVGPGGRGYPVDADDAAALPTPELSKRASSLLIETDDAIKTSEQELGFAQAEFGDDVIEPFNAALDTARMQVQEAFKLRQQLDDSHPETEPVRREMLSKIIQHCETANQTLDVQTEAFDQLRALREHAPEILTKLGGQVDALGIRLPAVTATMGELTARYSTGALSPVNGNIDQAQQRIAAARDAVAKGNAALAADNRGEAAMAARAGEDAVGQATTLLDAIDRMAADLAEAKDKIAAALTDAAADLDAAHSLRANGSRHAAELSDEIAVAEQAIASVRRDIDAGLTDPLGTLRRLEEADAALDRALVEVRDTQARDDRARAALDQTILAARAEIDAVSDFITTRRGAVGSEARTRLAEAKRHLGQAVGLTDTDASAALNHAQQAHALAEQANQYAQSDVNQWSSPSGGIVVTPGGLGRGGGMGGMGGLVLGGILIDSMFGGGGGTYGGRRGGGAMTPGSFGGRGTRARHGGGGRFLRHRTDRRRSTVPAVLASGYEEDKQMSQQSILGRIGQLARANINAMIDSAEDPERMLDQMIRDYTNNIAEAEDAVVQTIGNLRMVQEDSAEATAAAKEWGGKAVAASGKADQLRTAGQAAEADKFDSLARVALKKQLGFEQQVELFSPAIEQQTQLVDQLKSGLEKMKDKLDDLRTKRDELTARGRMAKAQAQVHDSLKSVDVMDPTSEVNRFEQKVRREEARVRGQQELAASSLDAQFDSLDDVGDDAEVEARLAALKSR